MKIGPSTIGAVVFTVVSVAAFGWMTQRPKASGQAIGFAMPSSGNASSSALTDSPRVTTTTAASTSSATESVTAEKVVEKTTETTEVVEKTPTTNDADTGTSKEGEAQTSESQAPTEVVAEEEKAAKAEKATTSSMNAESSVSSHSTGTIIQAAKTVMTETTQNSVASTDTSVTESTTPTTTQSSDTVSSRGDQAVAVVASSSEQQSSETILAPEQVTSAPEVQAGQSTSSESTSTNTPPAIQAVQLKSANGMSAGIYTAAANASGTVVILPGCDYKPEGDDSVVRPLHEGLPQEGWNTLSLQLPNLSASSSYKDLEAIMPDAAASIESGIAMAKEKSQTPVVLFAHGCGAQVALAWMEVKGSDSIDAYIGLGAGVMNASVNDVSHLRLPLEKMKFPQLDIYGSADNGAVLKTASERLSHINRAANPASRQKRIEGADHNITGKGKELSTVVVKWLNELAFKK